MPVIRQPPETSENALMPARVHGTGLIVGETIGTEE